MHALFILGGSAFLLCLSLTPLFRELAIRAGFLDKPDSVRRFHLREVPRVGGIPVALSYCGALGLVLWLNPGGVRALGEHSVLFRALLPSAALLFFTGLVDDHLTLRPWQKLLGQFAAAGVAVELGLRLSILPSHPSLSVALSMIWLIGCSNALNLIDGMDGLATGVALLATLTTLAVALGTGNTALALATAPLAGALLAFLRYNFSPASVFLGDCGSLTIGFALGCFGLAWSRGSNTLPGMLAPLMAMSLPLVDVFLAIGRRFLRSVPLSEGDRGHIHHRVQAMGFSTRHTALLLYAVCGLAALLAMLESFGRQQLLVLIPPVFVALVLLGVRSLQYVEFSAARKTFSHKVFRRIVQNEIYLQELDRRLLGAQTADEWWDIVRHTVDKLAFASASLRLDEQTYSEHFAEPADDPSYRIYVALGGRGHLHLTRTKENPPRHTMDVLHHIQRSLNPAPLSFGMEPVKAGSTLSTTV